MLVRDYLRRNAETWPSRIAYVCEGRKRTWGETADRSWRLAAALDHLGVRRGDAVGVFGPDGLHIPETWFAVLTLGALRTGINYRYSADEIAHICNDAQVKVLIIDASCESSYRAVADRLETVERVVGIGDHGLPLDYERLIDRHPRFAHWPELAGDELAVISYTTGSTGRPKGVTWTHTSIVDAQMNTWLQAGARRDDVYLHCLPAAGVPVLLATWNVFTGSTIVLMPRFSPLDAIQAIASERVTSVLWVPTMLHDVLEHPQRSAHDLSCLRLVMYGSAPATPALVRRAIDTFGCEIQQWYGSTEGAGGWFAILHHVDHLAALAGRPDLLTSCGRPTLHCEIAIRDLDGADVAGGEVGEVCVRSSTLMAGYLNLPAETTAALEGGWLRTGDLGRFDEDGYLYLVDRKNFMIVTGGYNVYPSAVENVIAEHVGVREVAVVGLADDRWGEIVCAAVVSDGSVTADSLIAHCRTRLATFEVPKVIRLVETLPRGVTGKILKRELRAAMQVSAEP